MVWAAQLVALKTATLVRMALFSCSPQTAALVRMALYKTVKDVYWHPIMLQTDSMTSVQTGNYAPMLLFNKY